MKSLTITYITARKLSEVRWMIDSLRPQIQRGDKIDILVVDYYFHEREPEYLNQSIGIDPSHAEVTFKVVPCKPCVWQGASRLTKHDYWAISEYRNTGLCLCKTEWFAVLDDRCVLMPTYLQAIRDAMKGGYAVCGRYQKRTGMTVDNGVIQNPGTIIGEDPRYRGRNKPERAFGSQFYGAISALPLEFALRVNGWPQQCSSLGLEDSIFGSFLERNKFPIKYDPRMFMVEDRTPELSEITVKRMDKGGPSPHDKSHGLLNLTACHKRSEHHFDVRQVRDQVLRGEPFPIPTEPTHDWWDQQALSDFP